VHGALHGTILRRNHAIIKNVRFSDRLFWLLDGQSKSARKFQLKENLNNHKSENLCVQQTKQTAVIVCGFHYQFRQS
jgi:hypothetical protein